ncbi:DUF4186 domain-containing protein [Poseidonocella sp. HB161398]|uniref:DUF4186 domain-containing protein n=1 Tax=Poseidonocella sp. HB161398 TaxID=2320855 RepID=UPI001108CCBC|nr:DUF4186 domain-containing protein [Poseidonocella sp. HB161398]
MAERRRPAVQGDLFAGFPPEAPPDPPGIEALAARLARSAFRSRFRLGPRERAYLEERGPAVIRQHAAEFIARRLAPAHPARDGRQTPMRGHPAFLAQHATGTCCRGCLEKWHRIPQGRALDPAEQARIADILMWWIAREAARR